MAPKNKKEINKNELKAKRKKCVDTLLQILPRTDVIGVERVSVCLACFSFQLLQLKMSPALLRSWLQELNFLKSALKVR